MIDAVILCAGKGKRMGMNLPKACIKILDKPMINHILDTLDNIKLNKIILVIGYKWKRVIEETNNKYIYCIQEKQLGTGHALKCCVNLLDKNNDVLVMLSDMPLVTKEIINDLIDKHYKNENDITLVTNTLDNPVGYGRIIRDNNRFKIVEEDMLKEEDKQIKEVNTGLFIANCDVLCSLLKQIERNNSHELYLTDIFNIENSYKIDTVNYNNCINLLGINEISTLKEIEEKIKSRV